MIREDLLRTVRDLSARHDTKAFAELVESVHPSDMAEALETLKSRDVARLLPCLKAGALAEVFVYFSEERQSRLLQELPRETVVALFEGMAADERVDLFHDLDEAARQELRVELVNSLASACCPPWPTANVKTSCVWPPMPKAAWVR